MAARGCSLKERRTSGAGVTFVIDGGTGHVLGGSEGPIPEYTGPAPAASNERTNSSFINNLPISLFGCLCFVLVDINWLCCFPYYLHVFTQELWSSSHLELILSTMSCIISGFVHLSPVIKSVLIEWLLHLR